MRHQLNGTTVDSHLEIKDISVSSKYSNRTQSVKVVNTVFSSAQSALGPLLAMKEKNLR